MLLTCVLVGLVGAAGLLGWFDLVDCVCLC